MAINPIAYTEKIVRSFLKYQLMAYRGRCRHGGSSLLAVGKYGFRFATPSSVALREYVPGNLIYANGHRFVARRFHRDVEGDKGEMPLFEVNVQREAVSETNIGHHAGALSSNNLPAIPVCDVDLMHQSQIRDNGRWPVTSTRFELSVDTLRYNIGSRDEWRETTARTSPVSKFAAQDDGHLERKAILEQAEMGPWEVLVPGRSSLVAKR